VSEQFTPLPSVSVVCALREKYVRADSKGSCAEPMVKFIRFGVSVNPHFAEIMTQAGVHLLLQDILHGLSAAACLVDATSRFVIEIKGLSITLALRERHGIGYEIMVFSIWHYIHPLIFGDSHLFLSV
jgi:hypothetical protein